RASPRSTARAGGTRAAGRVRPVSPGPAGPRAVARATQDSCGRARVRDMSSRRRLSLDEYNNGLGGGKVPPGVTARPACEPWAPARRVARRLRVLAILWRRFAEHTSRRTPSVAAFPFFSRDLRILIVLGACSITSAEARSLDFTVAADPKAPRVLTFCVPDGEEAVRVEAIGTPSAAGLLGTAHERGVALAIVRVAPGIQPTHVRIETAPLSGDDAFVRRLRRDAAADAADIRAVQAIVANPADVGVFHPPAVAVAKAGPQAFRPSSYPDLEGSPVRYLIV